MSNDAGHVFVIRGDAQNLACDAYLQSTDRRLRPTGGWLKAIPDAAERLDPAERGAFQEEQVFAIPVHVADPRSTEPTPVLTAVPFYGVERADQLRERVRDFFRVADEVIRRQAVAKRPTFRKRALVALPMFGHHGGGGGPVQGDILRVLYDESRRAAASYGFDVAVVLRDDARAYDLAQVIRRENADAWPSLSGELVASAIELGRDAAKRRLVPFMGSGVSVSAGAPTWSELIKRLAGAARLPDDLSVSLAERYDVLDQAEYLHREFLRRRGDDVHAFAEAVITEVDVPRYGLAPALLASLEAEQAITLNYDRLFEIAAEDAGLPRRVIPGRSAAEERWLLKLHGSVDDPDSIVLTRDHYLRYDADREALSSLARATLMTRRLLFVGFGMSDSHFHEIAHDVRRALPPGPARASTFGTVLTVHNDDITRQLWEGDLDFISFDGSARQLDIFLDAVLAHSCDGHSYVLANGYTDTLPKPDRALNAAISQMMESLDDVAGSSIAWPKLESVLRELGWDGARNPPAKRG